MHNPWTLTKEGTAGGNGHTRWIGQRGKNWDNCNSIINKIYLKKLTHTNNDTPEAEGQIEKRTKQAKRAAESSVAKGKRAWQL